MEKKRIVCFGDSLTWGFDLLPEDMTSGTKEEWLQALNEIDGFTLIDENEASRISEYEKITDLSGRTDILLVALQVSDWNHDLSPWKAPAVFGKEDFGDGAEKTLSYIEEELLPDIHKKYDRGTEGIPCIIGGYSLHNLLRDSGINSILEWNPGNHFRDADIRMASAFSWCIGQITGSKQAPSSQWLR